MMARWSSKLVKKSQIVQYQKKGKWFDIWQMRAISQGLFKVKKVDIAWFQPPEVHLNSEDGP